MSIATPPRPPPPPDQRLLLEDVSWSFYEHMLEEIGNRALRVTYDRGRMEIVAPYWLHEGVKSLIARLIEVYSLEKDIPILPFGSATFRRRDLQRGLEPDECYYVSSRPRDPHGIHIDLTIDPPPDLAIEVDITHGSIPREPIYAALGVPELWRYDGARVIPLHRQPDGRYQSAAVSLAFPDLPMAEFNRFLTLALTADQHAAVKAFQDWARQGPGITG